MLRNAVLVGLLGLTWGLNWPAVKLAMTEMSPLAFRAFGFTASTILMFLFLRARGISAYVPRVHWGRLLVVGALSTLAYNLFSAFAQLTASTSRSAVLSYTMPIWAVLFAGLFLGEPFDRRRQIGLALGGAGLVALGLPLLQAGALTPGLLFAVMSGIVWAAGSTVLKRFPISASPLVITAWQLALGSVACMIAMLLLEGWPKAVPALPSSWAGFLYNIVIGQAFATTLWFTILGTMPSGIASIGSLLVPGVGVIGATLILGERPTIPDWLGLALIVASSAVVLLRPSPGNGRATSAG